ncbi:hypothetical protein LguiA_030179 [Lonicera macranthoides]
MNEFGVTGLDPINDRWCIGMATDRVQPNLICVEIINPNIINPNLTRSEFYNGKSNQLVSVFGLEPAPTCIDQTRPVLQLVSQGDLLYVLFPNVKNLKVSFLKSIKVLIKGDGMEDGSLNNLQNLSVLSCRSLETIFDCEGLKFGREHDEVILGQLESVNLTSVHEVTHIWRMVPKGIQGFHNLRSLTVSTCAGLRYILTPSVAKMVVNLQALILKLCKRVEEVINMEDEEDGTKIEMINKVVLPRLHTLQLERLDNITVFCGGKYDLEVPVLEKLMIRSCPNMKSFCSGYLNAPKLERVYLKYWSYEQWVWKGNLNKTLAYLSESHLHRWLRKEELIPVMTAATSAVLGVGFLATASMLFFWRQQQRCFSGIGSNPENFFVNNGGSIPRRIIAESSRRGAVAETPKIFFKTLAMVDGGQGGDEDDDGDDDDVDDLGSQSDYNPQIPSLELDLQVRTRSYRYRGTIIHSFPNDFGNQRLSELLDSISVPSPGIPAKPGLENGRGSIPRRIIAESSRRGAVAETPKIFFKTLAMVDGGQGGDEDDDGDDDDVDDLGTLV